MSVSPAAHSVGRGEPVLTVVGLSAGYGDLAVVRGVDLSVAAGEMIALFGPNGAGKTTTLLTLAGELAPLAGTVDLLGQSRSASLFRRARGGMAFVPEERSVFMSMSVRDNLLLGRGGIGPALELFPELEPLLRKRAGLLSGGEQQMLTLGRALASRPRLLLLDELSLGLAPIVVDRLLGALRTAADERGVGVLLVEQQARRALTVVDRWNLMRSGQLVDSGDAESGMAALESGYLTASVVSAEAPAEIPDSPAETAATSTAN